MSTISHHPYALRHRSSHISHMAEPCPCVCPINLLTHHLMFTTYFLLCIRYHLCRRTSVFKIFTNRALHHAPSSRYHRHSKLVGHSYCFFPRVVPFVLCYKPTLIETVTNRVVVTCYHISRKTHANTLRLRAHKFVGACVSVSSDMIPVVGMLVQNIFKRKKKSSPFVLHINIHINK